RSQSVYNESKDYLAASQTLVKIFRQTFPFPELTDSAIYGKCCGRGSDLTESSHITSIVSHRPTSLNYPHPPRCNRSRETSNFGDGCGFGDAKHITCSRALRKEPSNYRRQFQARALLPLALQRFTSVNCC